MKRKFYNRLERWIGEDNRKPLLVVGARQVGKTWLISHFLDEKNKDWIYLNLEKNPEYIEAFTGSIDPADIIKKLEILAGKHIEEGSVLFVDEIQQSERAITALKYFCESQLKYDVIGAGSLLGVKLARFESSFPVGKVNTEYMYPMDFEEFLWAIGDDILCGAIREAYYTRSALGNAISAKACEIYEDYLYVGGMPEMVLDYISNDKNTEHMTRGLHDNLLISYRADMTRYTISAAEGVRITESYNSIPRQLAKENPKFLYKEIRTHANKRDFYTAIDWLDSSGMVYRVKRLERPEAPLKGYEAKDGSKIYLSDVGLLTHMAGLRRNELHIGENNIYKGAVTENYVVQQLASTGVDLHYYKPDDSMEIDIVYDGNEEWGIIPVEIKSGRKRRSTSLKNYCKKFEPQMSIRISPDDFSWDGVNMTLPLYAVFCLNSDS